MPPLQAARSEVVHPPPLHLISWNKSKPRILSAGVSSTRLHQLKPREQVGAGTGTRYEYQYTQAATDSLLLFNDVLVLYCEWHDDYVLENGPASTVPVYRFHQVKTRDLGQGPWTLQTIFGIKTSKLPKNQTAPDKEPFHRLLEHPFNFTSGCDRLVLVTNNAVDDGVNKFLDAIRTATKVDDLSKDLRKQFDRILAVHMYVQPSLTANTLFDVLRRFFIDSTRGRHPDNDETDVIALGVKIAALSEVDLLSRQAQRMGRDIVSLVRTRSGIKIDPLPPGFTEADLKAKKAIVVDDLLRLISLSPEGYRILKTTGNASALKVLSRLQRYCVDNGFGPELIEDVCSYKAGWDMWSIAEKGRISKPDLTALTGECGALVTAYASATPGVKKSIAWFVKEAKDVAKRWSPNLKTVTPLSPEAVLGLVFKIAADRGKP